MDRIVGNLEQLILDEGPETIAAMICEPVTGASGVIVPPEGYYQSMKEICQKHELLFMADEVMTGLGRTGRLWAVEQWGVKPDILITGKGLSGGLYPVSAAVLSKQVGQWLAEDGWGYVSTFGGAQPGCAVGLKALEICAATATLQNANAMAGHLRRGLDDIRKRHPFLRGINQCGLVMGLEFDDPQGGPLMSGALYKQGLWAMFASFDRSVLQFKAGLLVDQDYCDEGLQRLEDAIKTATGAR